MEPPLKFTEIDHDDFTATFVRLFRRTKVRPKIVVASFFPASKSDIPKGKPDLPGRIVVFRQADIAAHAI
jgi:hypothetical protein